MAMCDAQVLSGVEIYLRSLDSLRPLTHDHRYVVGGVDGGDGMVSE